MIAPLSGVVALMLAVAPTPARAQPRMAGMPDPAQMSGIPRPDPAVAAGTVTVRLIRGELRNRLPGVEVELVDQAKNEKRTEKTDAEGRATFAGLTGGVTYEARATVDSEALASQPIKLPQTPGVRVMLVFEKSAADQQKELGTPDGKGRVDLHLPPGVLVVQVVGDGGAPLKDIPVVVNHADKGTEKVDALPQKSTAEDGTVRFEGLTLGPGDGYLVSVSRDGAVYRSQPFRMVKDHGSQVSMQALKVSSDASKLTIAANSHLIIEMQDEMLEVIENLFVHNPLSTAVDPGRDGLRLPLSEGALSPQVFPNSPTQLTVDVSRGGPPELVWKGPLPPGDTQLSVAFVLKHTGSVSVRQATPLPFDALHVLVEKMPDLKLEGSGYESEDRKFNGRDLIVATAPAPKAGGYIEFSLSGLPHETTVLRYLAALLAMGVAIAFGALAMREKQDEGEKERRERLERRRQALLDQLLQQERAEAEGADPKADQKKSKRAGPGRQQLLAELEGIYRELDAPEKI